MDVDRLKPHLMYELMDTVVARSARPMPRSNKRTVNIDPMITTAMSGPVVFRMFARFVQANFILYPPYDEPYFRWFPDCQVTLWASKPRTLKPCIAFVRSAAVFGSGYRDCSVKILESLVDLCRIEMPFCDYCSVSDIRNLANLLPKITDFETTSEIFLTLLKETSISFPNLKRLTFRDGRFAKNCFPTVKNLIINITESDIHFSESDVERVAQWLKSFTSLTTADIYIHKCPRRYGSTTLRDSEITSLHNAFKSIDYGVPLQLTFKFSNTSFTDQERTITGKQYIEQGFPCFKHVPNSDPAIFIYMDQMPGKTFQHIIEINPSLSH
uniref:FBA_2 domain-containing protein n=1 Tax=Panagrellus redivivus TaxID=6233 RepID=A0A7E4VWW2_PANRE